ncbi:MAG: F0F1 ATP synthase subunit delta [Candidatus Omnitrophica bacterium]|nr:F0F1 ATP synthase subunit delta [Candidatus Omnitrophota bacterium]
MFLASVIIFQILIFMGLIFMFRKIMTQNVVSATKHIDALNQDCARKEQEINRQLEEIKQKSQETLATARNEAEEYKAQVLKETQEERDGIIKQARSQSEAIIQQADKSRNLLLLEIEERIDKVSIDKACELIEYTLPEQFKQDVHTHWVEELIESGFAQLQHLRMPEEVREIKITSAFPLTDGQRKNLIKKLKEVLARDITLKEEVDPKIVSGFIIAIGSLILDGSLRNKIQERARSDGLAR